jgi:hypothetical protein
MVWNEADELHSAFSLVSKVVHRVRRDKDCAARAQFSFLITAYNEAFTLQYENLMFPLVRMMRRVPPRNHLEVAHGKMLCAVILCYQPADLGSLGTAFCYIVCFGFRIVNSFETHPDHNNHRKSFGIFKTSFLLGWHVSIIDICFL